MHYILDIITHDILCTVTAACSQSVSFGIKLHLKLTDLTVRTLSRPLCALTIASTGEESTCRDLSRISMLK